MSADDLIAMLSTMPPDQRKYPVCFIRGDRLISVGYAVADEPVPGERCDPIILLISGPEVGVLPPSATSIGDRGR